MPDSPASQPEARRAPRWRRVGLGAAVTGWFAAIACALCWPVPLELSGRIIGEEHAGAWRTLWGYAWTLHRLVKDGSWPLDAPEIAWPAGGPFSSIAPVNDLLSLPLQLLFGLVAAHNLLILSLLVIGATGGYVFARMVGVERDGALVSGTVFGFNAFMLTYSVSSCVVETTGQAWIPWFLVSILWLLRRPGWRSAVVTGVLFAVVGLSSFYWALFVALFSPAVAMFELRDRRDRGDPLLTRQMVLWTVVSVAVAAVVFGLPAMRLLETYEAKGAVLEGYSLRKQKLLHPSMIASHVHDYATIAGYLAPGKGALAAHEDMDRLTQATYAGYFAMLLASIGLMRGRWRWLGFGLAGAVLSVGPFFFMTPDSYRPTAVWWWTGLRDFLPPIRMVTSYVRFSVFLYLGLGVLAGFGFDRLRSRLGGRWVGLGLVGSLLVVAETVWISPVPAPIPSADAYVPEASRALATLPVEGAVLDWPQRYPGRLVEVSRYFFYQDWHWRPIPYDFAPTNYKPGPIESNPFFGALEKVTYGDEYVSGAWTDMTGMSISRGLEDLVAMGYAYLVLHPEFVDPDRQEKVVAWLSARLPNVASFPDGSMIFGLHEPDAEARARPR